MRSEKQESCRWLKFWSSDTPSNYNPNNLPGALFFYTSLRPLNPSNPRPCESVFPVNQTGCCQIIAAPMWKHSAEGPISLSVFLALDE